VDAVAGRIYWANFSNSAISYATLNSPGGADLSGGTATLVQPAGVALDPMTGRIYWANAVRTPISFVNLNGTGGTDLGTVYPLGNQFPALLRAPVGAGAPVITGRSTTGSVMSCSHGTWAADVLGAFLYRAPQTFAYQWSLGGTDIPGATANSYTPSAAGDYRCRVSASNFVGSAVQTSTPRTITLSPSTPPGSGTTPGSGPGVPTISAVQETNSVFAVGSGSTPLTGTTARRHLRGTVFSFQLDQPATVRIAIQRTASGRLVGRNCRSYRRSLRHKRRCTRMATVAQLSRSARAGLNRVAFSGRIRGKALKRGRYQAVFTASDSAGSSTGKALSFTIVKS
jgi:hypothetical protein